MGRKYSAEEGGVKNGLRYNGGQRRKGRTMTTAPHKTTVEQFEAFLALPENADRRFELINGEIVEKMPTEEHGDICLNIGYAFKAYLKQNPIGRAGVDARYRPADDPENDRRPDVYVVVRPNRPVTRRGAAPGVPDIAVEVKSPDDGVREMREKALFYLANGAQLVWLVLPDKKIVEVYTPHEDSVLVEGDTLTAEPLLPGFSMPVSEVFDVFDAFSE
jgi:Uma2 family endonuclease